ncbi:agmatinase [uncultured Sphaerochaeta sp.]|uniref:agmatinase n=1 Tax=uncultured Sphaerochaeta sp. TaxID=886478 RepID=UPI002A0A786A|nr:agmatinase [uncultured Sphaerochaeta sp.]
MQSYFLDSEYPNTRIEDALFHVIQVPLEATVSYKGGTANGPKAIVAASGQLERLVEGMGEPGKLGIHTYEAVSCSYDKSPEEVFARAAVQMEKAFEQNSFPILLGGEHSVTNAAVMALTAKYEKGSVGILQFDAHMDLRFSYEGSKFSHASVMHRAVEAGIPLFQVGIRNYSSEDIEARDNYKVGFYDASQLYRLAHSPEGLVSLKLPSSFPEKLYITFDVDGFDASLMSATGTPDPGGLSWWDAITLLEGLTKGRTIVGADVVELAPNEMLHHCDYTAAKLAYYLMGLIAARRR